MATSPQLGIKLLEASQSQPEVIVNAAILALEASGQIRVLDKDLATPPTSPSPGDRYLLAGATPTGAWAGHQEEIAYLVGDSWEFLAPQEGWVVYVADENDRYEYSGSGWVLFEVGGGSVTVEGLDTGADTVTDVTTIQFDNAMVEDQGGGVVKVTPVGSAGGAADGHGVLTTLAISSNTITLDHSLGADFVVTLNANVTTVTHSNPTNGAANWFSLKVIQDGTGGRTFAPPASWIYPSGVAAYTASAGAGDIDFIQGVSYNDGTTWMISYEKDYA
jgi:hypothetical protein